MKNKLLFLLLWATIPVFSQLSLPPGLTAEMEVDTTFANQITEVFSNLDKSKIPNGLNFRL